MTDTKCDLASRHCQPCAGGMPPLPREEAETLLKTVPGWEVQENAIVRLFAFKNFYQTISFVNAVAWIAHSEDHHPDLEVSYKNCRVRYTTHAVGGLSENDFICAARINALFPG